MFIETLNKTVRTFEFIQSGLRGAPELLKHGGHVMMRYKDQNYNMEYDNKRCIIEKDVGGFYDTKP